MSPIDLTPDEFRRLGYRAVDILAERLATVRTDPVRVPVTAAQRQAWMHQPSPDVPVTPDALLDAFARQIAPHPMGNQSPRFFAWVNSPPAPLGVIADLLAAGLDPSVAGGDHAATYIEHGVLGWMRAIMGLPAGGGGVLTSGGSVATLVGLGVMRHVQSGRTDRDQGLAGAPSAIVYTSTQGHSCIQKAVEILGLGARHLRRVEVDAECRMDVDALRVQIAADRAAGLRPAAVVASAGTVNTGAIDPLGAIADLCAAEGLWLHVDASYGGMAMLSKSLRPLFKGIERADSVGIDPHKWLYMPVECGCVLVRDAAAMRDTFSLVPAYLRDDATLPWFSEFTVQQTRGFRALKLWMVLQQVGLPQYGALIDRDVALAHALQARIRAEADLELMASGPLSITCFRYRRAGLSKGDLDALNRRVAEQLQQRGDVFLTTTELHGRTVLRACIVNFRTTEDDLDVLVRCVIDAGATLA